jgi:hypothetical protein
MLSGTTIPAGTFSGYAKRILACARVDVALPSPLPDAGSDRSGLVSVDYTTMTKNYPSDWDITTEAEFDAALGQILTNAIGNDVDPRGSWVYNTDGVAPDLEAMVVELQDGTPAE